MSGLRLGGRWLAAFVVVLIVGSLNGHLGRPLLDVLTLASLIPLGWAIIGTIFAFKVRRARQR